MVSLYNAVSDIYGLAEAVRLVKEDKERIKRHQQIAKAVRKAIKAAGLSLYLQDGFASTVTVVEVPEGVTVRDLIDVMLDKYHILIAGCFDVLEGKVFRLGHMGNNANVGDVREMLSALTKALKELGFKCRCDMESVFLQSLA